MELSWHDGISKRSGIMWIQQKWKHKTRSPLTLQHEEAFKNKKNLSDLKELREKNLICLSFQNKSAFLLIKDLYSFSS